MLTLIYNTRRTLSVILVLVLFFFPLLASAATTNYQQQYVLAQGMLYDLLDQKNLLDAQRMFEELGTYKNAKQYSLYIKAILALYSGDLSTATSILMVLSQFAEFTNDLTANDLPVCETLSLYASARLLE